MTDRGERADGPESIEPVANHGWTNGPILEEDGLFSFDKVPAGKDGSAQ